MLATIPVRRGDRIRAVGGIGGGYGSPLERPDSAVVEDVLDGYLTREAAARDFRVAVRADGTLDATATLRLRAAG
jgi:N-methylhydantoinase B